jgi:hypothetical protein
MHPTTTTSSGSNIPAFKNYGHLVEALCYKPEGRELDSHLGLCIFELT